MRSNHLECGTSRFFVTQAILLVATITLLVFFTIPLIKTVKTALIPGELEAKINQTQHEMRVLQTRLDAVQSEMMMGEDDDQVLEKLRQKMEALRKQIAAKELEDRNLREEVASVQTMLEVLKIKSQPTPVSALDVCYKLSGLLFYILGSIGSVFAGGVLVISWWKTKRVRARLRKTKV